ncbi:aminotransferase class V-fold PLP-dependent enzyme [Testudinibacter aquarius]|uniref:Aminotransferase class V n=1 Tax=Testudinibacter aquarius TaxID=1524974 RepID=A0A4R3XWP9_9PAST|nr:aminotransferase class V-fold PLP-dependent enzyme [Testudinibacter aquarius]KAE9528296.1 hypothetical protein A1D24_10330 [Testudinibacter aquarius]TCV83650.1 aminotransferase class V [Testudinibacter aquarius]TNG91572.1 cysteine desulfurase [Testudinibacter aquarius]
MTVYPLDSLSITEATQKQFALVDAISHYFIDGEFLCGGDLGLKCGFNQPAITRKVEQVLARFFHSEDAVLVHGAGSGAIREGLAALLRCGDSVLVHQAPIYPTTQTTFEQMGLAVLRADFNQLTALEQALQQQRPHAVLIQHTRQQPQDRYRLADIIHCCNQHQIATLIDDNYAVLKVAAIGCELGATLSTFSTFKLFGPEGIGVVLGKQTEIEKIRRNHYSGGSQVQGHQALAVLRGMTVAPVMHAVQAQVNQELVERLNSAEFPMVKSAFLINAQSKVLIVEFYAEIAAALLQQAPKFGALPYPVGAESKYEIPPLFYQISGTFRHADPGLEKRMIRINPNRAGANTVLRILQQSYAAATEQ